MAARHATCDPTGCHRALCSGHPTAVGDAVFHEWFPGQIGIVTQYRNGYCTARFTPNEKHDGVVWTWAGALLLAILPAYIAARVARAADAADDLRSAEANADEHFACLTDSSDAVILTGREILALIATDEDPEVREWAVFAIASLTPGQTASWPPDSLPEYSITRLVPDTGAIAQTDYVDPTPPRPILTASTINGYYLLDIGALFGDVAQTFSMSVDEVVRLRDALTSALKYIG